MGFPDIFANGLKGVMADSIMEADIWAEVRKRNLMNSKASSLPRESGVPYFMISSSYKAILRFHLLIS